MDSVLVIDCSGRGHALADSFVRTNDNVFVHYVPGCDAVSHPRIQTYPLYSLSDHEAFLSLATRFNVNLVFVANAYPLLNGCADMFRSHGYAVVGPTADACKLKTSKSFAKHFFRRHSVPQADFATFESAEEAKQYVQSSRSRVVVKADGLCSGAGVFVCDSHEEALLAIDLILTSKHFGEAGRQLVIEDRLFGVEFSYFCFFDGESFQSLPMVMDYPRSGDRDTGMTCSGVGSITPHPLETTALRTAVENNIVQRVLAGLLADGLRYVGPIYFGCMLTEEGVRLLEINVRLGDPETQALLPRLTSDMYQVSRAMATSNLVDTTIQWSPLHQCAVSAYQGVTERWDDGRIVGMYRGWPSDDYATGHRITGLQSINSNECNVYFGKVLIDSGRHLVTASSRPITVVGRGVSLAEARSRAYSNLSLVHFDGITYRSDIGLAELNPRGSRLNTFR